MMLKFLGVSLFCFVLTCSMPGVASAQWYPPVRDPNATYRVPGTDDYVSGRITPTPKRWSTGARPRPKRRKHITLAPRLMAR